MLVGFLRFGKLRSVGIAQQRQVRQHRRLPTEILVEQQMLGCGRNPFLAAHHMGDPHQMVIDHIGEVIGRQAIRLHQHLHIDHGIFELDWPRAAYPAPHTRLRSAPSCARHDSYPWHRARRIRPESAWRSDRHIWEAASPPFAAHASTIVRRGCNSI